MHSMTGFGRGSHATSKIVARIEASSVNRKQGEVSFSMPRSLAELEATLRKAVLTRVSRGRVSVTIKLEHPQGLAAGVQVDTARARALDAAFTILSDALDRPLHPDASDFLRAPGIFADRCDITEETTRLRSHFRKFAEYLASNDPIGRSLDFLCQEMNREFNTIGSKANDATLAQHVVTAKTELEKAREQVQNIE